MNRRIADVKFRDVVGLIIMLFAMIPVSWMAVQGNEMALGALIGLLGAGGSWFFRDKIAAQPTPTNNNRSDNNA